MSLSRAELVALGKQRLEKYRREKHDAQPAVESSELPEASITSHIEPESVSAVQQLDTGAVDDVDAENMITPTATHASASHPSLLAPLKTHTIEPTEAVPDLFDELESDSDSLFQSGGISNLLSSLTSTWSHKQTNISKAVSDYAVSFAAPSSSSVSFAAPTPVDSMSAQPTLETSYQSTYVGSKRPLPAAVFSSDTINALQRFSGPASPQYVHQEVDNAIETDQSITDSVEKVPASPQIVHQEDESNDQNVIETNQSVVGSEAQVVVVENKTETIESIVQPTSPLLQHQKVDQSDHQFEQPAEVVAEVIEPVQPVSHPDVMHSDIAESHVNYAPVAAISSEAPVEQVEPAEQSHAEPAPVNVAQVTDRLQATIARLAQETDDLRSQNERLETQNQFLAMELKTSDKRVGSLLEQSAVSENLSTTDTTYWSQMVVGPPTVSSTTSNAAKAVPPASVSRLASLLAQSSRLSSKVTTHTTDIDRLLAAGDQMMLNLRSKTHSIQPVSVPSTPAPGAAPSVFQPSLHMSAMQQPGSRIQHYQNVNGVALSTTTPGRHVWPSTGGHHLNSPFRENAQSSSSSVREEIVTPVKPSSQPKATESRVEDVTQSDTVQSNQKEPTPSHPQSSTQPPSGSDVTPDSTSNPTPDASLSSQSHDNDTTPGGEPTPDGSSAMGMAQLLTALQTDSHRQNEQTTQAAQAAWTDVSSQIHSQTQAVQALMRRKQAVEEQVEQQLQLLLETVDPSAAAAFRLQLKSAVESSEHDSDLVGSSDAGKHVSLFASLMNNAYSVEDDENVVSAFASELTESSQSNYQPVQFDRASEAANESVPNEDERHQSISYAEQDDLALQTMARALRSEREASHAIKADHARLEQRVKDVMEEKAELLAAFKAQIEQLSAERDSVTQQLNDAQKELQTSQQRFKDETAISAQRLRVVTQEKQQLSAQLQNTRAALAAAENACRAWEAYTKQLQNDWSKEKTSLADEISMLLQQNSNLRASIAQQPHADSALFQAPALPSLSSSSSTSTVVTTSVNLSQAESELQLQKQAVQHERQRAHTLQLDLMDRDRQIAELTARLAAAEQRIKDVPIRESNSGEISITLEPSVINRDSLINVALTPVRSKPAPHAQPTPQSTSDESGVAMETALVAPKRRSVFSSVLTYLFPRWFVKKQ